MVFSIYQCYEIEILPFKPSLKSNDFFFEYVKHVKLSIKLIKIYLSLQDVPSGVKNRGPERKNYFGNWVPWSVHLLELRF